MKEIESCYILTNTLKTGGAEKQSVYLFKALKRNFETHLIVYYGDQVDQRMREIFGGDCERVIFLKGSHLSKILKLYILFKHNSNSICISYLATTNTINAILGKFAKVRIRIGGIRSSRLEWKKKLIQKYLHNYWLSCSVFNNYIGYQTFSEAGFKKSKSIVIHNCIEVPDTRKLSNTTDKINILTVGRFIVAKDYETSFKSIKELTKTNTGYKYTIIGQGPLQAELVKYISDYELTEFIELIVNPHDVDRYYQSADIYLSTSIFEGLSNSILEAMTFKLPVIATNVGDNSCIVIDNETGFLLPAKDYVSISQKLEMLINNQELRHKMGKKGYEHVKENFSVEKFTQKYLELIERLKNER